MQKRYTDVYPTPTIVTYKYAYVTGTVDLCAAHAENPPEALPALGPVSHGEHRGWCHACEEVPS